MDTCEYVVFDQAGCKTSCIRERYVEVQHRSTPGAVRRVAVCWPEAFSVEIVFGAVVGGNQSKIMKCTPEFRTTSRQVTTHRSIQARRSRVLGSHRVIDFAVTPHAILSRKRSLFSSDLEENKKGRCSHHAKYDLTRGARTSLSRVELVVDQDIRIRSYHQQPESNIIRPSS